MSRTTTVGSPATVPMTRLSPAGTGTLQWTSVARPGDPPGPGDAALDGDVVESVDAEGVEGCAAVGDEPPQAASKSMETRAAPLACTR